MHFMLPTTLTFTKDVWFFFARSHSLNSHGLSSMSMPCAHTHTQTERQTDARARFGTRFHGIHRVKRRQNSKHSLWTLVCAIRLRLSASECVVNYMIYKCMSSCVMSFVCVRLLECDESLVWSVCRQILCFFFFCVHSLPTSTPDADNDEVRL